MDITKEGRSEAAYLNRFETTRCVKPCVYRGQGPQIVAMTLSLSL
jgi:hypothetical protein